MSKMALFWIEGKPFCNKCSTKYYNNQLEDERGRIIGKNG